MPKKQKKDIWFELLETTRILRSQYLSLMRIGFGRDASKGDPYVTRANKAIRDAEKEINKELLTRVKEAKVAYVPCAVCGKITEVNPEDAGGAVTCSAKCAKRL